jgi:hypothetical protein
MSMAWSRSTRNRRRARIPHRMLHTLVPEVILNEPGIVPLIRQCMATTMAQHVRVDVPNRVINFVSVRRE